MTVFVGRLDEMCFLYLHARRYFPQKLHVFEWAPAVLVNYDPKTDGDALCILSGEGPSQGLQVRVDDFVGVYRQTWQVRGRFELPTYPRPVWSFQYHMTHYEGAQRGAAGATDATS